MAKGHFTGFNGALLDEDMVVQASMGPIVDRTKEHLCAADVGLVRARGRLLQEIAAMEQGLPAAVHSACVRPLDIVASDAFDWRQGEPA